MTYFDDLGWIVEYQWAPSSHIPERALASTNPSPLGLWVSTEGLRRWHLVKMSFLMIVAWTRHVWYPSLGSWTKTPKESQWVSWIIKSQNFYDHQNATTTHEEISPFRFSRREDLGTNKGRFSCWFWTMVFTTSTVVTSLFTLGKRKKFVPVVVLILGKYQRTWVSPSWVPEPPQQKVAWTPAASERQMAYVRKGCFSYLKGRRLTTEHIMFKKFLVKWGRSLLPEFTTKLLWYHNRLHCSPLMHWELTTTFKGWE